MRVLWLVVLVACEKAPPSSTAKDPIVEPVPVVTPGPGQVDCAALKRVIAVVDAEPTLTSLRGRELRKNRWVATERVLIGREGLISEHEDEEDDVDPQLRACLPHWLITEQNDEDDHGIRLEMPEAESGGSTLLVNSWVATSDDEKSVEVTVMVWKI